MGNSEMNETHWNTDNLCYIMAPLGFARRNVEKKNIKVYSPYYGDNMPLRILREICFRLPLLPKRIWYRKELLSIKYDYILVIDINITRHYLEWLCKQYPKAQINFLYDNMVGKARNIEPKSIPDGIRVWTYDDYDARRYNLRLYKNFSAMDVLQCPKRTPKYDVFFVGKDKGRGQYLLELQKKMSGDLQLNTLFIITKDKKTSRKKKYHQDPISYGQVVDHIAESRAILNITMENQEGVTLRDIEAVVTGTKLITNNRSIVRNDLYSRNNVFILGQDELDDLPAFLNSEPDDIWNRIKDHHTLEAFLDEITA